MNRILIKSGRVISPEDHLDGELDILIENGLIAQIAPRIELPAAEVIPATGCVVAPGFVDIHVHLREPGGEASETLATGLAAAVAGGFTAVCAMPNTRPVNDNATATRAMVEKARAIGLARLFPIGAVTLGSEGETLCDFDAMLEAGAVAFSDDGRPVRTAGLMRQALERARSSGAAIIDHCEDPTLSAGGAVNEGPVARQLGVKGSPGVSEEVCLARDLLLAEATEGHFHVAHLSTARAVEMVRQARRRGVRVTCEVTPHHFSLTEEAVLKHGAMAKMNPPLRSERDRAAVLAGLGDGTVDAIATDHAPHAAELKQKPLADAAFGITGLEIALPLAMEHLVRPGRISLFHLVSLMSVQPARIIRQPLGRLQAGQPADVTVFNPQLEWIYRAAEGRSKSHNSPFDGQSMQGAIVATLVQGKVVYRRA
jgi:dihydroorotase